MQRPVNLYLAIGVIVVVILVIVGLFFYRGRQPAMPTKPEEAVTIPPSGMPGPMPGMVQKIQPKGRQ